MTTSRILRSGQILVFVGLSQKRNKEKRRRRNLSLSPSLILRDFSCSSTLISNFSGCALI